MRVLKIAGAVLLLGAPLFAQDEMARKQAVEVAARVPFEKTMKGAPYSAETVVEGSQTLADGNRITRKTTGAVYRDSEGRTRREEDVTLTTMTANGPVSALKTTVSIIDPVAGFSYSLDPERKIAWKTTFGGANAIMGKLELAVTEQRIAEVKEKLAAESRMRSAQGDDAKAAAAAEEQKVRVAGAGARGGAGGVGGGGGVVMRGTAFKTADTTPLEHKTIEGVAVEGRKTTTVIAAGQVGNEQPITITSEEWRSPELNLLVLTKYSDPRSGESSYRLQNIIRAEPDKSLFMVPPDYTVKETGIRRMVEPSRKH